MLDEQSLSIVTYAEVLAPALPVYYRHRVELYGELAEEAAAKLRRGQQIALHGRLRVEPLLPRSSS